jgi:putative lipoic acid-binding regulatory protein
MADVPELEFPCHYPIKVICSNAPEVGEVVGAIVSKHAPGFDRNSIVAQESKNGNFVSLRISFQATDREQLDAMHKAITSVSHVKMVI